MYPVLAVAMNIVRLASMDQDGHSVGNYVSPYALLMVLLLLFPAVWLMGAISAALAVRIDFVSNLIICLLLFILGLVAQYFVTVYMGSGILASFLSVIVPNWQYFWLADALANGVVPVSYVILSLLYSLFYTAIWFIWALFFFQDAELARDSR